MMRKTTLIVLVSIALFGSAFYVTTRNLNHPDNQIESSDPATSEKSILSVSSESSLNDSIESLTICSFNVMFLGHYKKRDDKSLASILKDYDIVVIQELVAPPTNGNYPDGSSYSIDAESKEFFDEMKSLGFSHVLSEEDTGTNDRIHLKTTATEWWITFYKPGSVKVDNSLPNGFLADDRSNHDDYERVPYAFGFRTIDGNLDFVLISVHLMPDSSEAARRKHELAAIAQWIEEHDEVEKDFFIVGDMNIEDAAELADSTPSGFKSLNDECVATNTNLNGPKPYDHVMFNPTYSSEVDHSFDFQVVDLIGEMKTTWTSSEPFPGDPYNHNQFKQYFSDHHPVLFKMNIPSSDDD